jgi:hypothetical protein
LARSIRAKPRLRQSETDAVMESTCAGDSRLKKIVASLTPKDELPSPRAGRFVLSAEKMQGGSSNVV